MTHDTTSSTQRKQSVLISQLNVIASLSPGTTLSTTTMTVVDHNTWSTSVWRRYAGEGHEETVQFIKSLFADSIVQCTAAPSWDLLNAMESAVKGFLTMKITYQGHYYTIANITRIADDVRASISRLREIVSLLPPEEPSFEECVHEVIRSQVIDNDVGHTPLDAMVSSALAEKKIYHRQMTVGSTPTTYSLIRKWSKQQIEQTFRRYLQQHSSALLRTTVQKIVLASLLHLIFL